MPGMRATRRWRCQMVIMLVCCSLSARGFSRGWVGAWREHHVHCLPRRLSMEMLDADVASRGDFLRRVLGSASALALSWLGAASPSNALRPPTPIMPPPKPADRPLFWQVLMTDPPQLQPYTPEGEKAVVRDLAQTCSAIFLGEHPDSDKDHELQARLIETVMRYKPRDAGLAIGLEMVQQSFQPALDDYIGRVIADDAAADQALREAAEWDVRWGGPLERYLPVLRLARSNGIRLVALNVESEAISKVREAGLEGLTQEERGRYVADPTGFILSVKDPQFKLYTERFILPSYASRDKGEDALSAAPSLAKFFAARILWDETMATAAARYLQEHPRDLMVMLVGADHVKFGMGAPARLERLLKTLQVKTPRGRGQIKSILLNPTPEDTGSQTRRLRLSLGYAASLEKCKPVGDFLWYSESPKVAWLEHPQNPLDRPYKDEDTAFQIFSQKR